ncbi:MAG: (2Fe-2S) ferredoxin domain-containing protein, partial [Candidatus Moraniibacteriota bacterium]
MESEQKPIIKVCTHADCCQRGSEGLFEKLQAELYGEATVLRYPDCFDHCEEGPNVSVNGNLLRGVRLSEATKRVREELR